MTEINTSLYSDGFADGYRQGRKDAEMNDNEIYDPVDLVRELADKIGIHQLYAIARDLRGEPDSDFVNDCELHRKNEELKATISYLQERLARSDGMIEGLKFALRCDGVSGGEVN